VQVLGGAGFRATSAERLASMQSCDALGAEFKHREAMRARRLVVVPHRYESVMRDPRWAPAHQSLETVDWDGFAAAPLESRGRVVGTLSAFYPSGLTPTAQREVERLAAVADEAAAAVDNAGLLAKTRRWAVDAERNRLGRELHDAIVQDVFSLAVHSRTIQVSAETDGPLDVERIRAGAAELIELSRSALTALRALIFELRPPALQDHSLVEAVRAYAASMTGRCGVPIAVLDERADTTLPEVASDNIYRVVQEALHNVVRHARASEVTVSFADGNGRGPDVVVEIVDDGDGFDPGLAADGHLGLITMRERAEDLGGFLEVRSRRGHGARVILRVPKFRFRAMPSRDTGPSADTVPSAEIGQQG
jgi:signal transduction histidine kinase